MTLWTSLACTASAVSSAPASWVSPAAPLGGFNVDTTVAAQTFIQCAAALGTAAYTAIASYVCLMITKAITGGDLRVPEGAEQGEGLDKWCHGESCYTLSEGEEAGGQPASAEGREPLRRWVPRDKRAIASCTDRRCTL